MLQRLLNALWAKLESAWYATEGWRTVIFGALLTSSGIVLALLEFLQTVDLNFLFSPRSAVVANIVIGVAVILLRWCTTTPLGTKPEKDA